MLLIIVHAEIRLLRAVVLYCLFFVIQIIMTSFHYPDVMYIYACYTIYWNVFFFFSEILQLLKSERKRVTLTLLTSCVSASISNKFVTLSCFWVKLCKNFPL